MQKRRHRLRGCGVITLVVLAFGSLAGAGSARSQELTRETGIDRRGGDYESLALPSPDACIARCRGDQRCAAFTFVQLNAQAPQGQCWLKSVVPLPHVNNCCLSGVKTGRVDEFLPDGPGTVGDL